MPVCLSFLTTDPLNLRADFNYFGYFTVHQYDNFHLPCLPSHPAVNVTLLRVRGKGKQHENFEINTV